MAKFRSKGGNLVLIFTPVQKNTLIGNIFRKLNSRNFVNNGVSAHRFVNGVNIGQVYTAYTAIDTTGNTTYECGFEVLNQNQLRLYLPTGTTTDITIANVKDSTGEYAIWEFFKTNVIPTVIPDTDFARPTFKGLFAVGEATNAVALQDNFKRQDGVLSVAPSGHPYTLFRNSFTGITKYDVSDGIYNA